MGVGKFCTLFFENDWMACAMAYAFWFCSFLISLMVKILITQHPSLALQTAYASLIKDYDAQVDFQRFSEPVPISLPLFRTHKALISNRSAFLFTNQTAINSFFDLAKTCSILLPDTTKYFLAREGLQKHLRKHVEIKKRKLFCGTQGLEDLFPIMPRYKKDRFLFPSSETGKNSVSEFFTQGGYDYTELAIYKNAVPNLDHIKVEDYGIIVFFSPVTVRFFHQRFPAHDFGNTKVAVFGEKVVEEAKKLGWPLDIVAPVPGINSMLAGLQYYFENLLERKRHVS